MTEDWNTNMQEDLDALFPTPAERLEAICGAVSTYEDAPTLHVGCALNKGHDGPHGDGDYLWWPEPGRPEQTAQMCKCGQAFSDHSELPLRSRDSLGRRVTCFMFQPDNPQLVIACNNYEALKKSHAALLEIVADADHLCRWLLQADVTEADRLRMIRGNGINFSLALANAKALTEGL